METERQSCQNILTDGSICNSHDIDSSYFKNFDIKVCNKCKHANKEYELISKKDILDQYMITESSIRLMKFISKPNPKNPHWPEMKLYLRKDCKAKALERWTNEEGFQDELNKRKRSKFAKEIESLNGILSQNSETGFNINDLTASISTSEESLKKKSKNDKNNSKAKNERKLMISKMAASIKGGEL